MSDYRFYLPPGWVRLDLTDRDSGDHVDAVAKRIVRSAPLSGQPALRKLVQEGLVDRVAALREQGVGVVLLPLDLVDPDPARPVVAFANLPASDADPLDLVQAIALGDPSASVIDIEGLVALRTRATADVTEKFLAVYAPWSDVHASAGPMPEPYASTAVGLAPSGLRSERVGYLVGDPDHPDRWISAQFSVEVPDTEAGTALADRQIGLFDAVMSTFGWTS